jgi:HDOD domain
MDRNSVLRIQPRQLHPSRQRFGVPVMPEILLLVELEVQEFCVDLRALSQLVLSDLGATLQVLRLAGREYGLAEGRPTRVEDCIADMGLQACIEAMSAQLVPRGGSSMVIAELWSHCREIARQSKHIAEQTVDIDPDQAYLVGLCHSIGSLPAVLGWSGSKSQGFDSALLGLELAREWSLPGCVFDYFCDVQRCGGQSPWPEIVQAAHRCAGQLSGECASSEDLRPQLLRAV